MFRADLGFCSSASNRALAQEKREGAKLDSGIFRRRFLINLKEKGRWSFSKATSELSLPPTQKTYYFRKGLGRGFIIAAFAAPVPEQKGARRSRCAA